MDENNDKGVSHRCSVEDAEEGTILCRRTLSRWGPEFLQTSSVGRSLATMVRVVQMHEGPDLQEGQQYVR
jgi:hypothetical protein